MRILRLISIIRKIADLLGGIDLEKIGPILQQIVDAITAIFDGGGDASVSALSVNVLSNEDAAELQAAGLDIGAIVQLIMLIVELIKSLRGGN